MISQTIPDLIVGFREGMEAFLIIGIMLSRYQHFMLLLSPD